MDGRVATEELEQLLVGAIEFDEALLIFLLLLLRFLLALPRLLPFWHLPCLHRPTLKHKSRARWASHRITDPESRCSHLFLPHPTRARQVTDTPRFPLEPAALPQPPTPAGLTRGAVPIAGPSRAVGAGGGGPGAGPRARSPRRCRLARSSLAGLGLVPFQLEPAPRPAPALPASPRPPLLPFPFPPGPLPAKKSLFKLSSVRGRARAAEGPGSALGGHLGGAAPSVIAARWRPGGPRDHAGRSRTPRSPQQGAGSPAPARWGTGNGAAPRRPPRRRGRGVPAVMWEASRQGWPEKGR